MALIVGVTFYRRACFNKCAGMPVGLANGLIEMNNGARVDLTTTNVKKTLSTLTI
jgi:hypothetical protein